jgi:uncharacterized FlaG/YvyC family protein
MGEIGASGFTTLGGSSSAQSMAQYPAEDNRLVRAVRYLSQSETAPAGGNQLKLSYDDVSQRLVVFAVQSGTGTILYQIPTLQVLRMAAAARRVGDH